MLGRSVGKSVSMRLVRQQNWRKNCICLLFCFMKKATKSFCGAEIDDVNLLPFCQIKSFYLSLASGYRFEGGYF